MFLSSIRWADFPSKWPKLAPKICKFTTIQIYKSSDAVSIGPGVKMTIFPTFSPEFAIKVAENGSENLQFHNDSNL